MFAKSVKTCLPLFSEAPAVKKNVLSPLPIYWQERCCQDEEHVSNISDPDFKATIFTGLDTLRRSIKDVLHTSGVKNFSVHNTSQLCTCEPGGKTTNEATRDALAVMWRSDDPVHPSEDAYATLASNISGVLVTTVSTEPGSQKSQPQPDRPLKRPRWLEEESSNTVPVNNNVAGRGQWSGEAKEEAAAGSGAGGREAASKDSETLNYFLFFCPLLFVLLCSIPSNAVTSSLDIKFVRGTA
jgi:hypothetical protein